jgi:hypothetical protein
MMWQPVSGCGPQCRGGDDSPAAPGRAALRVVTLAGVLPGDRARSAPGPAADRRALARAAQTSLGVAGYRLAA